VSSHARESSERVQKAMGLFLKQVMLQTDLRRTRWHGGDVDIAFSRLMYIVCTRDPIYTHSGSYYEGENQPFTFIGNMYG
jgi:hypothetical protein